MAWHKEVEEGLRENISLTRNLAHPFGSEVVVLDLLEVSEV